MKKVFTFILMTIAVLGQAQNFTSNNLVVSRVGNGTDALSTTSSCQISLLEFSTSGTNQTPVQTVDLGTSGDDKIRDR